MESYQRSQVCVFRWWKLPSDVIQNGILLLWNWAVLLLSFNKYIVFFHFKVRKTHLFLKRKESWWWILVLAKVTYKRDLFGRVLVSSTDQTDLMLRCRSSLDTIWRWKCQSVLRSALIDVDSIAGEKAGLPACLGTHLLLSVNGCWYSMPDCFHVP